MEETLSACADRSLKRYTNGLSDVEIAELRRMLEILRGDRSVYEIPSY
jgi:hypothetical protein